MSARDRLAGLGRAAALAATALALLATSSPGADGDCGEFDADTTCGPAGVVTVSFSGASQGCGDRCTGLVETAGAGAVGLPELGEILPDCGYSDPDSAGTTAEPAPGAVLASTPFALVGLAPVAGASPPAVVRRVCRATASATPGVLDIACGGDAAEAACAGTLTLRPAAPSCPP